MGQEGFQAWQPGFAAWQGRAGNEASLPGGLVGLTGLTVFLTCVSSSCSFPAVSFSSRSRHFWPQGWPLHLLPPPSSLRVPGRPPWPRSEPGGHKAALLCKVLPPCYRLKAKVRRDEGSCRGWQRWDLDPDLFALPASAFSTPPSVFLLLQVLRLRGTLELPRDLRTVLSSLGPPPHNCRVQAGDGGEGAGICILGMLPGWREAGGPQTVAGDGEQGDAFSPGPRLWPRRPCDQPLV